MKKALQIVLPILILVLGYAETQMQAFAAENGAFVELLLVRIGIGIVTGGLLCVCISTKSQSPVWPASSLALLLIIVVCYIAPTGLHRYLPSIQIPVICMAGESYLLLKACKTKERKAER